MNEPSSTILLVEDNDDDVFALKRALKKAGISNPLQVLTNGQQAIDYCAGIGSYANREQHPIPFLVFLDLKMPYRDGFEVLTWIREQPALNEMVVVVLTGSDEIKDHQRAYALGARSYLVKPPAPDEILRVLESMHGRWSPQREQAPAANKSV